MSTLTLGYIVVALVIGLLIYSVVYAFRHKPKVEGVLGHIQFLRKNIGAAFLFGIGLTFYSQSQMKSPHDWQYGGPLLAFITAILYGYARKAEKAAVAQEASK
jgi:hypothetical protein